MAHYAALDENNVVTFVFVGKDESDPLPEGYGSWEQYYNAKRCSYNTSGGEHPDGPEKAFRKNYPSPGFVYDEERDAFIPPKPFPSFLLDPETCTWGSPIPNPGSVENPYVWRESILAWVPDSVLGEP